MRQKSPTNRGPAAAPANRRAILTAARTLFAERGYQVPLSAIAKAAGVGQGVLYRHFPRRLDLAFAVFEEHFAQLEHIGTDVGPQTFTRLWWHLVDLTITQLAFIEMAVDARQEQPDYDGEERLRILLRPAFESAHEEGLLREELTLNDVILAQRMLYGLAVAADTPADAERSAARMSYLLGLPGRPA